MSIKVLYHASCQDGFGSAWICHQQFKDAEFFAVNYGDPLPPLEKTDDVYVVDFSFKLPLLEQLANTVNRITIIDHHQTAEQDLDIAKHLYGNCEIIFDNSHSGAYLTWKYFYPNLPAPKIILYLEDRDLWKWQLPYSHEISAAIASYPFNLKVWDDLFLTETIIGEKLITEGTAILRYQKQIIDKAVKQAVEIVMDGYNILSMNTTTLVSEIGNELCKNRPFSGTYFIRGDGKKIWSLRSSEDGLDVSVIAKLHGGGGHKHASGFTE